METNETSALPIVQRFSTTLLWPLQINKNWSRNAIARKLESSTYWRACTQPFADKTQLRQQYASLVYFHPFVQQVLYSRKSEATRPFLCFERNAPKCVELTLGGYNSEIIQLQVKQIRLLLFELGVALFLLEVEHEGNLQLGTVQATLDQFRRAYPPYWERSDGRPGHFPQKVEWEGEKSCIYDRLDLDADPHLGTVARHAHPPVAKHFAQLLAPLKHGNGGPDNPGFSQIGDERIPLMTWIAVDDPKRITPGDWVRLTFADEPGDPCQYPYATSFLKHFEDRYCYDRFWGDNADAPWLNTRILCCGYAFTMVGPNDPSFFADEVSGALAHYRNHYRMMGVLAHFQRAALLVLSERVSESINELPQQGANSEKCFRVAARKLQKQSLRFTHRYWFQEISGHIQARELFNLWTGRLDTQKLYDQVHQEIAEINRYIDTNAQIQQGHDTLKLTHVATAGLFLSLVAGFFGSNLVVDELPGCWENNRGLWDILRCAGNVTVENGNGFAIGILVFTSLLALSGAYKVVEKLFRDPNDE